MCRTTLLISNSGQAQCILGKQLLPGKMERAVSDRHLSTISALPTPPIPSPVGSGASDEYACVTHLWPSDPPSGKGSISVTWNGWLAAAAVCGPQAPCPARQLQLTCCHHTTSATSVSKGGWAYSSRGIASWAACSWGGVYKGASLNCRKWKHNDFTTFYHL